MFTLTNILLFLAFFHVISTIVMAVVMQMTQTTTDTMNEYFLPEQKGLRFVSRTLIFLLCLFIQFLVLLLPYVLIMAYFGGAFDNKEEVKK